MTGTAADRSSIVVVVGHPQPGSRTAAAATALGQRLAGLVPGASVATVEVADLGAGLLGWGDEAVAAAKAQVLAARAILVASPTFKATYSGLLKLFLDQFAQDEMAQVPAVVPLMTGAGRDHALAVEVQLRPVLVEIGASCPTRGVFLSAEQIDDPAPALDQWWSVAEPALRRALA